MSRLENVFFGGIRICHLLEKEKQGKDKKYLTIISGWARRQLAESTGLKRSVQVTKKI